VGVAHRLEPVEARLPGWTRQLPCSRPPSRRRAGSASAPGVSARSPPQHSSCSTPGTTAPH